MAEDEGVVIVASTPMLVNEKQFRVSVGFIELMHACLLPRVFLYLFYFVLVMILSLSMLD